MCVSLVNIFGGVIILLVDIFQFEKKTKDGPPWLVGDCLGDIQYMQFTLVIKGVW